MDAVFSRAVFHWIPAADQQAAIDSVRTNPGGWSADYVRLRWVTTAE